MRIGIAGLGSIGGKVARMIDEGKISGMELTAVCSGSADNARARLASFNKTPLIVAAVELPEYCDIIVECANSAVFCEVAEPAVRAGRVIITVNGAAILEHPGIVDLARKNGSRIVLVTGALLGLDAIRAASEGEIRSVRLVTRKPPDSLAGAPYLKENNIDIDNLTKARRIFSGTARQGARGFPANVNVAAAIALAGVGADETMIEIWADPSLKRNKHSVLVDSDSARFAMQIENIPSEDNPRTGRITPLSVIAALRSETAALRVGT